MDCPKAVRLQATPKLTAFVEMTGRTHRDVTVPPDHLRLYQGFRVLDIFEVGLFHAEAWVASSILGEVKGPQGVGVALVQLPIVKSFMGEAGPRLARKVPPWL